MRRLLVLLGVFYLIINLPLQAKDKYLLLGFNQYNDDVGTVIGDKKDIIGNISGINVNVSYVKPLSTGTFIRIMLGTDLASERKVEDPVNNNTYTFEHSRIELPILMGFSQHTKNGQIYSAIGFQYFKYTATLTEEFSSGPAQEYEYSVSEMGSPYFLFGMEGKFGSRSKAFLEMQYSYANGIGSVTTTDNGEKNIHLRPAYIRWNVGIAYGY